MARSTLRARRFPLALAAALVLPLAGACSDDDSGGPDDGGGAQDSSSTSSGGSSRTEKLTVDPATAGSVAGVVRVSGTPPARERLKMIGDAWCMGENEDGGFLDQRLHVEGDKLVDAFVWIVGDLDDYDFEPPATEVVVDQVGCLFVPHVVGVQRGQTLMASNSDAVMHNVHTDPEHSRPQNFGMPEGAKPRELKLKRPEIMVPVICDVHAWMRAWIGVLDHPFFAVTGEDGAFRLDGVPPGDHVLGVWHEKLGTKEIPVTVGESQALVADDVVFAL
jgi:plastocyanin